MKTDAALTRLFCDLPLFSALSESQLERVQREMCVVKLNKGDTLFGSQQTARRFFVLRRGRIKLFRLSGSKAEKIIHIVRPGESIATAVMFMEQKTYPVCAEALQESRVLSFDSASFLSVLKESPQTCFRIMAEMSQRMRQQVFEIDQLSLRCAPSRVADYLLEISSTKETGKPQARLTAPKRAIASRLSIQPETFSRILRKLQKKDLIEVDGATIHITSLEALRDFVNESACGLRNR